jgi:hypothetical protein
MHELIRAAEPLSNPVAARFPHRLRRRYELLRDMPSGLVVLGDAICSFSPVLGQGMSIAALEVELLDRCLREQPLTAARRFFAGAARIIDPPWRMASGSEPRVATDGAALPLPARVIAGYMKRLIHAAGGDARVCSAFLHVAQLQKPARTLFAPSLIRRVVTQPAVRWPERHDDGDTPTQRLNARLSAASEP